MARKQKRYHYIYKTTNVINLKFYVGMHSTDDLNDGYIGSGKYLWNSIRKYGRENFNIEFLEFFDDRKSLVEREKNLVNEHLLKDALCMNLTTGGGDGWTYYNKKNNSWKNKERNKIHKNFLGKTHSVLTKKLMSDAKQGSQNPFLGKKHTKASKELMSSKAKLRIGNKNSQFGTCWVYNHLENKKIKKEDLASYLEKGYFSGRKNVL